MIEVEWDVAELTRELIDSAWADDVDRPATIRLQNEDERGNPTVGVNRAQEYVLVASADTRGKTFEDGFRDMVNTDAAAFIECATPDSRERREELWRELLRIAEEHRKRSVGTPGNWDHINVDGSTVPDDRANWWVIRMTWRYAAFGRTV